MRARILMGTLAAVLLLPACTERPQVGATAKSDAKPWEGTRNGHLAEGWKPGDQASWEAHLKARSQGQDEYTRAPAQP